MSNSEQITILLNRWQSGDAPARNELFELVYRELRRIAGKRLRDELRPPTLEATELVHEIYPQLARQYAPWHNRSQFYAIASECMRRYLVDHARTRLRQKRGSGGAHVPISEVSSMNFAAPETNEEILAVDRALQKLEVFDQTAATVIKYRYFGGMSREEIAELLNVSPSTVDRTYRLAKAWLKRELLFELNPYLLSSSQITNQKDFLQKLRQNGGSRQSLVFRRYLSRETVAKIDAAPDVSYLISLLPQIIKEINQIFISGSENDPEICRRNRFLIENAFPHSIEKISE